MVADLKPSLKLIFRMLPSRQESYTSSHTGRQECVHVAIPDTEHVRNMTIEHGS